MPNWCDNNLTISGPKKIIQKIEQTNLSLNKLIPCPEELNDILSGSIGSDKKANEFFKMQLKNNIKKYGSKDWYDWNVKNWGTKWDISPNDIQVEYKRNTGTLSTGFQSAWAPPVEAMKKLKDKYPEITIRLEYIETGASFAGSYSYSPDNGDWEDEINYSNSEELLKFAKDTENYLAECEAEYIAEREEEDRENAEESS